MFEQFLIACVLLGLVALSATALFCPHRLLRWASVARAFGLTVGLRVLLTRLAGAALLAAALIWLLAFIRGLVQG